MTFYSLMRYILRQHFDVVAVADPHKGLRYEITRKTPIIDPHQLDAIPASVWDTLDSNTVSVFAATLSTRWHRSSHIYHVNEHLDKSVTQYPALKESDVHAFFYSSDRYKAAMNEACNDFEGFLSVNSPHAKNSILFNLSCYYTADELDAHILTFKEPMSRNIYTFHEAGLLLNYTQPEHFETMFEQIKKTLFVSPTAHDSFFSLIDNVSDDTFKFLCMQIKAHYERIPEESRKSTYLALFKSIDHTIYELFTSTKGKLVCFYSIFENELYSTFGIKFYESFIHSLWTFYFKNDNLKNIPLAIEELAPKITHFVDKVVYQKLPPQFYDYKINPHGQFHLKEENVEKHFQTIFGSPIRWGNPYDKQHQAKVTLAELRTILFFPELCVDLLKEFETSLQAAWEKEFPEMPINKLNGETMPKKLESVSWKIPVKKPTFKANSFLQRHCIQFMQQRGYAKHGSKMMSFISDGGFENAIRKGDFFTEPAFNPYFLLHGKISHNIGRIILMRAYEENLLSYSQHITLDEIFSSLVNPDFKNPVTQFSVWSNMFDLAVPLEMTFCDPHLLHASLMSACDESLPCLSAAMTHSFGKKVYALTDYFNWATKLNWSAEQVWDGYIAPRVPYAIRTTQESADSLPFELTHYLRYAKEHQHHTTIPALLMYTHRLYEGKPAKEECKPPSKLHLKN